ncbi:DEAD/DEAH box helicase [Candidatus Pacearchaeota archaeon]|nr:DEAD/DEAH box helicase [Candidatus Pacearchaeota archaeon]
MEKFKQLGISEELLSVIRQEGFESPSEVQEKTIPLVLAGKDVIGSSATGSGKTLAFGAGIIDLISAGDGIQALIMTPTRELAEQVGQTISKFGHKKKLRVTQIYGGVSMGPQVNSLRYVDIVVGTPGRLLDHIKRRTLNLSRVKFLVLDEADRMLDMGFIHDVESIIKHCPSNRQTLLFSATLSQDIEYMAKKYMKNPVFVEAGDKVDPSKLYQVYYDVTYETKLSLLVHLLKQEKNGVVMVFCNTRRNTDKLTRNLATQGLHAESIHGGHTQNRRSSVLKAFHSRDTLILICTDVAARGLDIKDVSHVYNYDIPKTGSEYIHRIGRTARAGKNGIAISFVSSGDHSEFRQILRQVESNIEKQTLPPFEIIKISSSHHSSSRGRRYDNQRTDSRSERTSEGRSERREGSQRRFGSASRHSSRPQREDRRNGEGRPSRENRSPFAGRSEGRNTSSRFGKRADRHNHHKPSSRFGRR